MYQRTLGAVVYDPGWQLPPPPSTAEPLDAPVVELGLEYDPTPATGPSWDPENRVREELLPVWAIGAFLLGAAVYLIAERI